MWVWLVLVVLVVARVGAAGSGVPVVVGFDGGGLSVSTSAGGGWYNVSVVAGTGDGFSVLWAVTRDDLYWEFNFSAVVEFVFDAYPGYGSSLSTVLWFDVEPSELGWGYSTRPPDGLRVCFYTPSVSNYGERVYVRLGYRMFGSGWNYVSSSVVYATFDGPGFKIRVEVVGRVWEVNKGVHLVVDSYVAEIYSSNSSLLASVSLSDVLSLTGTYSYSGGPPRFGVWRTTSLAASYNFSEPSVAASDVFQNSWPGTLRFDYSLRSAEEFVPLTVSWGGGVWLVEPSASSSGSASSGGGSGGGLGVLGGPVAGVLVGGVLAAAAVVAGRRGVFLLPAALYAGSVAAGGGWRWLAAAAAVVLYLYVFASVFRGPRGPPE